MPDEGTTQLPHSESVESALVARLLVDPSQLPVLAGRLAPEDFYAEPWRRAYAGMQSLSKARKTVDIVSLRQEVGASVDDLGQRITEITAAHRAPLEEYADIIRSFAFRRRLIGALDSVTARAYVVQDREALLADLHAKVVEISSGTEDGRLLSPTQAVEQYLMVQQKRAAGEIAQGLSWGLSTLDRLLLPAQGGEMIVIAARPSVGKTALAEQVSDHWAKIAPRPILFVSLEMSLHQLMDRTVSRESGIEAREVVRGILTTKQERLAVEAAEARRGVGLWYLDNPFATTNDLRSAAAKLRMLAGGISGIVVDYLQLLKDRQELPEVQRVTGISRTLKAIAREMDVPMIVLSQLNRSVTTRDDQRPRLHDLRESGAIEQDADRVIALSRVLGHTLTNVEVLKARQGPIGDTTLLFDGDFVRFIDNERQPAAPVIEPESPQTELPF